MTLKTNLALAALAVGVMAAAQPARAEGLYLVGSVGMSDASGLDTSTYNSVFSNLGVRDLTPSSTSRTNAAYKFQLGYAFTKNLALEGGYFNLGESDYHAWGTYNGLASNSTAAVKADGWDLSGVGTLPLSDRWALFGKLGLAYATVNTNYSINADGIGQQYSSSASGNNWGTVYGLGATYNFNRYLSLRGEYELYNQLGTSATGKSNVNVFSVGAMYKF